MTILELIQKTTSYFEKAGIPNPRLDVELLASHVLKLKRMELYIQFERVLTTDELDRLRPLVKRRGTREPLQHILGTVNFFGLELSVSPHALIPRQETELLAEAAIQVLGEKSTARILDLGTGTGALVLAIAHTCPQIQAVATDISKDALELARQNARTIGLEQRIEFHLSNLFESLKKEETFDLIVSNPPYIPSAEIPKLQPEVQFDPKQALDGGIDGLEIIRKLVHEATYFLKPEGWLMLEIGHDQAEAVRKLFQEQGLEDPTILNDLHQIPRIVKGRKIILAK